MTTISTTTQPAAEAALASDDIRPSYIAWGPLAWIGALHIGALAALLPMYFSWWSVAACLLMHWVTGGLGITLCYHRLLTHRSFAFRPRWLEYFFTAIGCMASEGGAIGWVADHRRHHAHSDDEHDVHSPTRGFGWAHMFWFMTPDITSRHTPEYYKRWAPDLVKDPVHRWLDDYHLVFPILSAVLAYGVGVATGIGGMSMLVWSFFLRSVTVLHTTWLVNSATHIWGYRTHETRDKSTNLWWVALVTFGEGWHNNHHAFQTSARHGMRWWEIDMTYMFIRALETVGLTYNVKVPKTSKAALEASEAARCEEAQAGLAIHGA